MNLRSTPLLVGITLLGGCALVYNYGEFRGVGGAGTGGAGIGGAGTGGTGALSGTGGASTGPTTSAGGGGGSMSQGSSSGMAASTASSTSATTSSATSSATSTTATSSAASSSSSGGGCSPGLTCTAIPALTAGWSGPIVLQPNVTGQATCTATPWVTPLVFGGTAVTGPSCSTCTCTGPSEGNCPDFFTLHEYGQTNCAGSVTSATLSNVPMCQGVSLIAAKGLSATASGTVCAGSAPPLTGAAYSAWTTGCASSTHETCQIGTSTETCAPTGQPICVYKLGVQSCPPSYTETTMQVYSGGVTQTGVCGACSCTVTAQGTCAPLLDLYSDGACLDAVSPVLTFNGTQCYNPGAGTIKSAQIVGTTTPTGASCASTGQSALMGGSAGGTNPTTVCCTQ